MITKEIKIISVGLGGMEIGFRMLFLEGEYKMEHNVKLIDEESKVVNWDKVELSFFKWMRSIAITAGTVWVICEAIKGLFWLSGV